MLRLIPADIIIHQISPHLSNLEKLYVVSTDTETRRICRDQLWFENSHTIKDDIQSTRWYYHALRNIYLYIVPDIFPSGVKKITFSHRFNRSLMASTEPSNKYTETLRVLESELHSCTELQGEIARIKEYIQKHNIRTTKRLLPDGITHLTFGTDFDQDITDSLPETITHLTFGGEFNRNISSALPNGITHLTFGRDFNQSIDGKIPPSVTHLKFGHYFNKRITQTLPLGITHLTFRGEYTHDIDGIIPTSVTHLVLSDRFDRSITRNGSPCLPNGIIHLTFGNFFNQDIHGAIPLTVTHLIFGSNFNQVIGTNDAFYLPSGLIWLELGECFQQSIKHIPCSITHLVLKRTYDKTIYGEIPFGIKHLTISSIVSIIPSSVTHLTITDQGNKQIQGLICHGVTHLTFGTFDQPIGSLIPFVPDSADIIRSDIRSRLWIMEKYLPESLVDLQINTLYTHSLIGTIPNSVKTLLIGGEKKDPNNFVHPVDKLE